MVAAGHRESARAGAEILARGGNAVDAVCAAACAAAIAETPLTGPGAGGFLLARTPDGEATLLDFFVHPALFWVFGRKEAEQHIHDGEGPDELDAEPSTPGHH